MTKEQICILIAMAVYMIAVVVIGVICVALLVWWVVRKKKKTAASESGCHGMCSQRSGRSFGRRFRYRLRRWKGRLFSRRKDRKDRGGRGNHRSGDI